MKAFPHITKESQNLLLRMKYDADRKCEMIMPLFISQHIDPKTYTDTITKDFIEDIAFDYCDMARHLKRKINLCLTSAKKIKEIHDEMAINIQNHCVPQIVIPKNSKFIGLKKYLPKDFEKITSKKRIIKEGAQMHHCVASYAEKINQDACAIYSVLHNNKRYTLEFRKSKCTKSGYILNQIRGVCNTSAPKEFVDYIEELIT